MRAKIFDAAMVCLVLATNAIAQVPGVINYQGRVSVNGTNFDGAGLFKFALVNGAAGTTNYWSNTGAASGEPGSAVAVTVTKGLYSVLLGDTNLSNMTVAIPPTVFTNADVRLRVWFSDGTGFQLLTPDQRLAAIGYAMMAANVANGAITTAKIADGAITSNKIANGAVGAAQLDSSLTSGVYVAKAGDTMSGNLNLANTANLTFGAQTRQMVNLWDSGIYHYGIGVQNDTLYFRAATNVGSFAWYQGGVHATSKGDGGGGSELMALDSSGLTLPFATSSLLLGDAVNGWNGQVTILGHGSFPVPACFVINPDGKVGVGYDTASSGFQLLVNASNQLGCRVQGPKTGVGAGLSLLTTGAGGKGWEILATGNAAAQGAGKLNIRDLGTGVDAFTILADDNVLISNNASVCSLTIRGGCDVAEPFIMAERDTVRGSVVIIDEDNPGRLKLSDRAYDTRVAGIVSGANGINPGIALHQAGVLEGGQNVALSGRVYVLADASNGAIKPGDLLTTSETPGHAMKVTDRGKAQGAVIGKAMSGLTEGKGLVLVLVSLQ